MIMNYFMFPAMFVLTRTDPSVRTWAYNMTPYWNWNANIPQSCGFGAACLTAFLAEAQLNPTDPGEPNDCFWTGASCDFTKDGLEQCKSFSFIFYACIYHCCQL